MTDDGYIKFNCDWQDKPISMPLQLFQSINNWRTKLHNLKLIGVYETGIGFGNISCKNADNSFFITGSATGQKTELSIQDYAHVTKWDFKQNHLKCIGNTKASSESLSHAATYESDKNLGAVIHIHSIEMWKKYQNILPTTSKEIQYGTPKMAYAIAKLLQSANTKEKGIIIMGGHEEGILTFGKNIDQAGKILLEHFTNL